MVVCGDCFSQWCARNRKALAAFRHRLRDRPQIFQEVSAGSAVDVEAGEFLVEFDRVGSPLTELTVGILRLEIHLA